MKLLVGLGNPGPKYAGHRHNIGFRAVDEIAALHNIAPWRPRFQGEAAEGRLGSEKVLLLKPATYMNQSGRAVGEAMRFYKLTPEDVIVFHDDLDLAPGKVRVKKGGGHAGHNGLKSVAAHIGGEFWRVRIGIGHPGNKAAVVNYVLHDFSKAEETWLEALLDAIARAAVHLIQDAPDKFMNEVARLTRRESETARSEDAPPPGGQERKQPAADEAQARRSKAGAPSRGLAEQLRNWLLGSRS